MNTFSQGTDSWKKVTEGMTITAYEPPSLAASIELEIVEPGPAVNLPAEDRARMNHAMPGIHTTPERL